MDTKMYRRRCRQYRAGTLPEGVLMPQITITEPIKRSRTINEFAKHVTEGPFAGKLAIAQFDDGKTRGVEPAEDEKLTVLVTHVRNAARLIGRSAEVRFSDTAGMQLKSLKGKGVPEGAVKFKFTLRELITRAPAATKVAVPVAEPKKK